MDIRLTEVDKRRLRKFKALLQYSQKEIKLFLEFLNELESRDNSTKRKSRKPNFGKMQVEAMLANRRRKIIEKSKKSK